MLQKVTFFFLAEIVCLSACVLVAEETAEIGESWHEGLKERIASYEEAKRVVMAPLDELREAYLSQLGKIKTICQERGNLEQALAVETEIEAVKRGNTVVPEKSFSELDRAQSTYQTLATHRKREIDPQLKRIKGTLIESLDAYQASLTKEGHIELAVEVKECIEHLTLESEVTEAKVIELFWAADFEGESVILEVPIEIPRFAYDDRVKNDQLRSIRIPNGVEVTISPKADLSEDTKTLRKDQKEISQGISSLRAVLR